MSKIMEYISTTIWKNMWRKNSQSILLTFKNLTFQNVWHFILLKDPPWFYCKKLNIKNHLQSTARFVACLVTFDSINHTGHHVFKTICSGAAFLFRRIPLPSIGITVLPQGRCKNQTKFITWKKESEYSNKLYHLKNSFTNNICNHFKRLFAFI